MMERKYNETMLDQLVATCGLSKSLAAFCQKIGRSDEMASIVSAGRSTGFCFWQRLWRMLTRVLSLI